MPNIELPDGKIAEFPDGMPQEEIKAILRRKFPPSAQNAPKVQEEPEGGINPFKMDFSPETQQSFQRESRDALRSGAMGGAQGFINSLIGTANILPRINIPKSRFAPQNEAARIGEIMGDVASYSNPSRAAIGIGRAVKAIPEIAEAINGVKGIKSTIESARHLSKNPFAKFVGRAAGAGTEGAIFGASHAEPEDRLQKAAEGGEFGAGVNALTNLLGSKYPLVSRAGLAGLGYLGGKSVGHPYTGMAAAFMVPQLKGMLLGLSEEELARKSLEGLTRDDVRRSIMANKTLGTQPTPGQASGSYVVQGKEGRLRREAGILGEQLERKQIDEQRNAVKNFLDKIYKPSKEAENKISSLYKKAYEENLPQEDFDRLMENKIFERAFKLAEKDTSFQEKMKGIPNTNYEYLDEAKTKLDRMFNQAIKAGDKRKAQRILDAKEEYLRKLDSENPAYRDARRASQPKIVREKIEDRMNVKDEDVSAKNLYKSLIDKRKTYREALRQLKNFPEARKDLGSMRQAWKEYANIKTGSQAESQGKSRIDDLRNTFSAINNFINTSLGKKYTEQQAKYIHSKAWESGFDALKKAGTVREQNRQLLNMLGKLGVAYGLSKNEISGLVNLLESD